MYVAIIKIFTGDIISPVIGMAFIPLIARIYSPSDFGGFQFYVTWAMIFAPVCNFSLGNVLLAQKDRDNYSQIMGLFFLSSSLGTLFSVLTLLVYSEFFIVSLKDDFAIFLFPIMMVGVNYYYISRYIILSEGEYSASSKLQILNSFLNGVLKVLLGTFNSCLTALMFSLVLANSISSKIVQRSKVRLNLNFYTGIKSGSYISTFLKHKDITVYMTASQFLMIVINWHLILIAPIFTNMQELGYFSLAHSTVNTAVYPFIDSLTNYCIREQSRLHHSDSRTIIRIVLLGFILAFIVVVVLIVFGLALYGYLFGSEWLNSYDYAIVASIPAVLGLVVTPFTKCLGAVLEKNKLLLKFDVLILVALLFGISCAYTMGFNFMMLVQLSTLIFSVGLSGKAVVVFCIWRKIV